MMLAAHRWSGQRSWPIWRRPSRPCSSWQAIRETPFLLESVEGGAVRGRYSMIGYAPDLLFRADGKRAAQARVSSTDGVAAPFEELEAPALDALRQLIADSRIDLPEDMPPMSAGVFGYLGYDTVRLIEKLPHPEPTCSALPDILLMRPTIIVVFDAVRDEITVVTPVRPDEGSRER
jgi:anthranilate synthase component 1